MRSRDLALLLILILTLGVPAPLAQAALITTQQEVAIGRDAAQELEDRFGVVQDAAQTRRLSVIGARLAAVSARRALPWRFRILNQKEVNAISLPGGFIYVTRGMLRFVQSDDELAFVLAHEVAHVNQRHHVSLLERYFFLSIVITLLFGGDTTATQVANFVGFLLDRGFNRSAEFEADRAGVGLAHRSRWKALPLVGRPECGERPLGGGRSSRPRGPTANRPARSQPVWWYSAAVVQTWRPDTARTT